VSADLAWEWEGSCAASKDGKMVWIFPLKVSLYKNENSVTRKT